MFDHTLEHICSYSATLRQPLDVIGETPVGLRVNAYISGGEIWGPRLLGRVLPVGADWLTIRPDGVGALDVRTTIETSDGTLVYVEYMGVMDLGPDGYLRRLTSNPRWLNRLQCLNVGMTDFATSSVSYDTHAVRSRVLE